MEIKIRSGCLQQPNSVWALKDNDTYLKQLAGKCMKSDLTSEQFFCDQMNGGAMTIGELVGTLSKYNITTIRNMLFYVQKYLEEHLNIKNQGLNQLKEIYQHGYLTPLCAILSDMHTTLVVLRTSLLLADAEQVYSAVGKMTNFQRITKFPSLNEKNVDNLLKHAIDLSECAIPPDK
ncbi:hypothetical protein C1646_751218 [Rhizophagus diaphanus]|nr:hypothetical protein C1646_751218 [Rhizophagus diaphanus] [Rhizophagus sp. MUCL 43196]